MLGTAGRSGHPRRTEARLVDCADARADPAGRLPWRSSSTCGPRRWSAAIDDDRRHAARRGLALRAEDRDRIPAVDAEDLVQPSRLRPSRIWTWTSRIRSSTRWRSSSGAASEQERATIGLHGALEVVPLQARVAGVEVGADRRAVGLVELVVDEVDDPLEEVGALARGRLVRAVLVDVRS